MLATWKSASRNPSRRSRAARTIQGYARNRSASVSGKSDLSRANLGCYGSFYRFDRGIHCFSRNSQSENAQAIEQSRGLRLIGCLSLKILLLVPCESRIWTSSIQLERRETRESTWIHHFGARCNRPWQSRRASVLLCRFSCPGVRRKLCGEKFRTMLSLLGS